MSNYTAVPAAERTPWASPVVWWATAGAGFVLVQLYVYGSWIASPGFRPTETGTDPIPAHSLISMYAFQALSIAMLIGGIVWFVRGIRATGRIDATRLMMLGWLSAYWLDPFLNFLRPMFTYNAYLVNMGSWANFIPGFMAPNGDRFAEPLLVDPANYFVSFTLTALAGLWGMQQADRRWPGINPALRLLAAVPPIWISMGVLDVLATTFMHFDGWLITKHALSLFGGQFNQFPLYEFLVFPAAFVASSALLYYTDADGHTVVERGVTDLALPSWLQTTCRILAVVAFCNVANWLYTTAMGLIALLGDPWPAYVPSWLSNGQIPFI